MSDQHIQDIYQKARTWVLEAGARLRSKMHEPLVIETKSDANDLVTEMDQETERFFAEHIRQTYPDHRVMGEEGFGDNIENLDGTVWIVDPIDGTMNFVHQKQNFAISVGIFQDGVGVIGLIYDVMADSLYHAIKGQGAYKNAEKLDQLKPVQLDSSILCLNSFWAIENKRVEEDGTQALVRKVRGTRSYGSAALEFAYVAEGSIDAYITMRLAPWDIAAGIILVNEVGGRTTQADGSDLDMIGKNSIITGNPSIHQEIIDDYITLK